MLNLFISERYCSKSQLLFLGLPGNDDIMFVRAIKNTASPGQRRGFFEGGPAVGQKKMVQAPRGVDPYGTGGTRPPQYLDWGDMITNAPPQYF